MWEEKLKIPQIISEEKKEKLHMFLLEGSIFPFSFVLMKTYFNNICTLKDMPGNSFTNYIQQIIH